MKKLTIALLIVLVSLPAMAQQEALYGGKIENGWYAGISSKFGRVNSETGYFLGGQGGWIINHRFVLGAKGYMLVNPFEVEGLENITVGFGYGGAFLEYIIASNRLVHLSIEGLIGAGGVYNDVRNYSRPHDPIDYTGDAAFVMEPGVNLILNVTKTFRVGAGVTYRFVNGMDYDAGLPYQHANGLNYQTISDSDLSGVSAQIVLKFGVF